MTLKEVLALTAAGYTKQEIMQLAGVADPQKQPEEKKEKSEEKQEVKPETTSEVEFLRKQVQDLQTLNLLYASGRAGQNQQESEMDIMRILMNGKESETK